MKFILPIVLTAISLYAQGSNAILGVRSSKYAYVGYENNKIGVILENSVFVEDVEKQYARAIAYYHFLISRLYVSYGLYYGSRYNHDFYDYGAILKSSLKITEHVFRLDGIFMPFYDSDLKLHYGYSASISVFPFTEVGFVGGFRNIPDYRDVERRVFAGIEFDTPHLILRPEISTPLRNDARSVTRFTINFIYRNPL
jgi:hypothetical protein